jgi:hypothetical protein
MDVRQPSMQRRSAGRALPNLDIPEALCDVPERFEEIVTDFERACRKAIAAILEE